MKVLNFNLFTKKFIFRLSLLLLMTVILLLSFLWWTNRLIESSATDRIYTEVSDFPSRDVGLVLGTNPLTRNRWQNLYFTYRIEAAADLYAAGKVKHLVLSGDNGRHGYNEPEYMRDALLERGVPLEAMSLDYAGFRTLDSVFRCRSVFGYQSFAIISQEFHNKRAIYLARKFGLEAIGFNAQEPFPNVTTKVGLREVLARAKAFLDINILGTQPKFAK